MQALWSDLPFFLALARSGTLSAAATALKVDRTTVARRVEHLEEILARPLFERLDGSFDLTVFGRGVLARSEAAEQELAHVLHQAPGARANVERIRVSLSEHLLISLADCFHQFMLTHANILLELTATDRFADLTHFETDVAIRISRAERSDLITHKIGTPIFQLYRRRGHAEAERRFIARPGEDEVPDYVLHHAPGAEVCMSVDGLVSAREMIAQGSGIAVLPQYFGDGDPRLERCSDPLPSIGYVLSVVLRPEQRRLRRMVLFVDFVKERLSSLPDFKGAANTAS